MITSSISPTVYVHDVLISNPSGTTLRPGTRPIQVIFKHCQRCQQFLLRFPLLSLFFGSHGQTRTPLADQMLQWFRADHSQTQIDLSMIPWEGWGTSGNGCSNPKPLMETTWLCLSELSSSHDSQHLLCFRSSAPIANQTCSGKKKHKKTMNYLIFSGCIPKTSKNHDTHFRL